MKIVGLPVLFHETWAKWSPQHRKNHEQRAPFPVETWGDESAYIWKEEDFRVERPMEDFAASPPESRTEGGRPQERESNSAVDGGLNPAL